MKQLTLRPQDVAVALQLAITPANTFAQLSQTMSLSASEVHQSVKRLRVARLLSGALGRRISARYLEEFIYYGVRFAFPVELGTPLRGVPTAHSGPALIEHFERANRKPSPAEDVLIWPSQNGEVRGLAITPLYAGAPETAKINPKLYELLTLVDAMRIGKARERALARTLLSHALRVRYA